jgi:hypothetical protein
LVGGFEVVPPTARRGATGGKEEAFLGCKVQRTPR